MAKKLEDSLYTNHIQEVDSPTGALLSSRNRCCFNLPCFRSHPITHSKVPTTGSLSARPSVWNRIRVAEIEGRWWAKPITALKKIREWSEIVAGPKWKTFIRRFNRNNHGCGMGCVGGGGAAAASSRHVNCHYDAMSYALNFDEGMQGGNGQGHNKDDGFGMYPDFASRYVSAKPGGIQSSKNLMECRQVTTDGGC